jgi:hypothetical protein
MTAIAVASFMTASRFAAEQCAQARLAQLKFRSWDVELEWIFGFGEGWRAAVSEVVNRPGLSGQNFRQLMP